MRHRATRGFAATGMLPYSLVYSGSQAFPRNTEYPEAAGLPAAIIHARSADVEKER